jgi:hypothetical protein
MNTHFVNNNVRPSDYQLSRYLLGECTPEENENIEQWKRSSNEALAYFSKYKESIAEEEHKAPAFNTILKSNQRAHKFDALLLYFTFKSSKVVVSFSCLLLLCLGTWLLKVGHKHENDLHCEQQITLSTWHDTLQTIFTITEDLLYPKEKIVQTADSSQASQSASNHHFKNPKIAILYGGLTISDNVRF